MTTQFITNQDRLMSEVMNNMMPNTKALHFLVGFFYFSGFSPDRKRRMLVTNPWSMAFARQHCLITALNGLMQKVIEEFAGKFGMG